MPTNLPEAELDAMEYFERSGRVLPSVVLTALLASEGATILAEEQDDLLAEDIDVNG